MFIQDLIISIAIIVNVIDKQHLFCVVNYSLLIFTCAGIGSNKRVGLDMYYYS